MKLAKFLDSLSITAAGELTFQQFIDEGFDTLYKINEMSIDQMASSGKSKNRILGEKTAEKIYNSLHSARVRLLLEFSDLWIDKLDDTPPQEEENNELLMNVRGKKLLFTGEGPFSRATLTAILKRNGAIVQSSLTKETDILILADLDSNKNKAKKARKYGTKMITYEDIFGW